MRKSGKSGGMAAVWQQAERRLACWRGIGGRRRLLFRAALGVEQAVAVSARRFGRQICCLPTCVPL